jgi:hypothetical protein
VLSWPNSAAGMSGVIRACPPRPVCAPSKGAVPSADFFHVRDHALSSSANNVWMHAKHGRDTHNDDADPGAAARHRD